MILLLISLYMLCYGQGKESFINASTTCRRSRSYAFARLIYKSKSYIPYRLHFCLCCIINKNCFAQNLFSVIRSPVRFFLIGLLICNAAIPIVSRCQLLVYRGYFQVVTTHLVVIYLVILEG